MLAMTTRRSIAATLRSTECSSLFSSKLSIKRNRSSWSLWRRLYFWRYSINFPIMLLSNTPCTLKVFANMSLKTRLSSG